VRRLITTLAIAASLAAPCPFSPGQGLRKFGTPKGKPALRGFGNPIGEDALRRQFPKLAAAVNDSDRQGAGWEIQRTDGNADGVVTLAEWDASGFQPGRFQSKDLNRDGNLTFFEHTLNWAQWRMGKEQAATAADAAKPPPPAPSLAKGSPTTVSPSAQPTSRDELRAKSRHIQIDELTAATMALYDRNRNRRIEKSEFHGASQFGDLAKADTDKDGAIIPAELAAWLYATLNAQPAMKAPETTPPWFRSADANDDGQVHLSEYRRVGPKEVFTAFDQYDRNADGIVTALEAASPSAADAVRYPSTRPAVIEAEMDTQLDLLITDDVSIRDIDLQLALVKNGDDDIALYLIAPDGTKATLYFDPKTKPWSGGRLFGDTLIDDEAPIPTQRLTRPPLHRSFRSQGSTTQGHQGLKAFYGKNARGTWHLHIRNSSQIAGLLEGWALLIKPAKPAAPAPQKR